VPLQTAANWDVFGKDYWYSKILNERQDLSRVKAIQKRWQADKGIPDKPEMMGMTRMEKTEESVWREPLHDAISTGDVAKAREIIQDVKRGMTPQRWLIEKDELIQSIKSKQPIQGSEVVHYKFSQWARQNISPEDQELIRRVDNTYRNTAKHVGLGIEFKPPSLQDRMDFEKKLKTKKQDTSYPWSPIKF
jgi:hypothetical protein